MLNLTFKQAMQRGYIKPVRNKKYLMWMVKSGRCPCGADPTEAHHLIDAGLGGGMGSKASDLLAFPICRACHVLLHTDVVEWEDLNGCQWEHAGLTIAQAVNDGKIILK